MQNKLAQSDEKNIKHNNIPEKSIKHQGAEISMDWFYF